MPTDKLRDAIDAIEVRFGSHALVRADMTASWPTKDGRSLPALRLVPGEGADTWFLLPGLYGVERCHGCGEWVPIWSWAQHAQGPGEHRAPEHGELASLRAAAKASGDHLERSISEEEAKIARYAIRGPSEPSWITCGAGGRTWSAIVAAPPATSAT